MSGVGLLPRRAAPPEPPETGPEIKREGRA